MCWLRSRALVALAGIVLVHSVSFGQVTVSEDAQAYTMQNGIVTAKVSKVTGDLISLIYKGEETLEGTNTGHHYAFWSHDARSQNQVKRITIDPATNGGERAEVSVKGISGGNRLGTGPGGGFVADIEIRYAMEQGKAGVYTYSIFEHKAEYPNSTLGEARFCAKLVDTFDFMLVGNNRNMKYTKEMERVGDNKYNYTQVQFESPAFGWASTTKNVGFFFVNASVEYLTGPPTKVEFLCHRDTNQVAAPCVLNYWRSSHYGGGSVDVAQGENWTKVIGPFLVYVNSGPDPETMYADANAQVQREAKNWPYDWVAGVDYPRKNERATVKGQLVPNDAIVKNVKMANVRVGLAHPDYTVTTGRAAAQNSPSEIDWQVDSKHYSFWVKGNDDGSFEIPAVRPGKYTLHAFADGVLGEYAKTDITIVPGKNMDLGKLDWQIVRKGKPVWEIGVPNRSGSEFVKGDDYFHGGMARVYTELFPIGTNFVIGKSDIKKDWYFQHPPSAGPWTVTFDLPAAPKGKATLRLAFAGKQSPGVDVAVNEQPAGQAGSLWFDSSIGRNQIRGIWAEREVSFDASQLKAGTNTIKLSLAGGGGVIYDYLRLELDESAK